MLSADANFVLLEDARFGGGKLFREPKEIICTHDLSQIDATLECVRQAVAGGAYVAGWISYEAGLAFEQRLLERTSNRVGDLPLIWFGVFDAPTLLSAADTDALLPSGDGAWLSPPRPRVSREAYQAAFSRAHAYIVAGDVYQINLSYRAALDLVGDPIAAYARLRRAGQGRWSGLVRAGDAWLLSTSPELFFSLKDGAIEARPMKGTAKRGADSDEDKRIIEELRNDQKERAENLMIVDLLRNDMSRLAQPGSVHVPALFSVESYPTLHALTSTVRAEIREQFDVIDVLKALFPCGSITGAPKVRAMEIIDELEADARGVYTGSVGWIAPHGAAEFNVAIRTLVVHGGAAELGLGSAVVFDSTAEQEWAECEAKGAFVTADAPSFDLIETMRFEPSIGLSRLERHLSRLRESARVFGFSFKRGSVLDALMAALDGMSDGCVVRLALSRSGEIRVTLRPLPLMPAQMRVALAPLPVAASDFRLRHKTTLRHFYDEARVRCGADEVVFFDAHGFVTEGSFSNVFVERGSRLVTPPASRGLLPGVLRGELIEELEAVEGEIRTEDLVGGFYLGNSVRGLLPARLASNSA